MDGFENGPYSPESYDAAAITLLAMEAAKTTTGADVSKVMFDVTNAPGMKSCRVSWLRVWKSQRWRHQLRGCDCPRIDRCWRISRLP